MIIMRFSAGLGNQMLQYACYLALQQRYPGTRVAADIRVYNFSQLHNGLELERLFPIHLDVLYGKRTKRVKMLARYWHFAIQNAFLLNFKSKALKNELITDSGSFNDALLHLDPRKNYYLQGQWGNEKYFNDVKELLREHFSFKIPLDTTNERNASAIQSQNSVAVHIRRGDYTWKNSSFVDLAGNGYYPGAVQYMTSHVENPVFYIFSDDTDWCRENLPWLNDHAHHFITGNKGGTSYRDMQLMSMCKHNIIANSTFSWWSGWLNRHPGKIVICPKTLFNEKEKNEIILSEFYPESWIRM